MVGRRQRMQAVMNRQHIVKMLIKVMTFLDNPKDWECVVYDVKIYLECALM